MRVFWTLKPLSIATEDTEVDVVLENQKSFSTQLPVSCEGCSEIFALGSGPVERANAISRRALLGREATEVLQGLPSTICTIVSKIFREQSRCSWMVLVCSLQRARCEHLLTCQNTQNVHETQDTSCDPTKHVQECRGA